MKIIQINAWCGRLTPTMIRLIQEENPDIVCMQEVFLPKERIIGAFEDQYNFLEEIVSKTDLKNMFFSPTWGFKIGGTKVDVGNCIISKHKITNKHSQFTNGKYHVRNGRKAGIPNTRLWQCAVIETPGSDITAFNYHGYLAIGNPNGDEKTISTLKSLRDAVINTPGLKIICGDFNIKPGSDGVNFFNDNGLVNLVEKYNVETTLSELHRAPKEDRSSVACDFIYSSPEILVKSFVVSEAPVSDHSALILEFDL